jgi:Integrase core domain/GAG-pre-integrase domain
LIDESRRLQSKEEKPMALTHEIKPKRQQQNMQNGQKQPKQCYFCKKKGHLEANCFLKYPEKAPKNAKNRSSNKEEKSEILSTISIEKNDILVSKNDSTEWILDSGASTHICCDKTLFSSLFPTEKTVKWGNATSITAEYMGNIELIFNSTKQKAILENCLYVPDIRLNLLSLGRLAQKGLNIQFYKQNSVIERPNKKIIAKGYYRNNLSVFDTYIIKLNPIEIACLTTNKQDIWHQRMGHIGSKALKELPNAVKGVKTILKVEEKDCDICIQSKITAKISRKSSSGSTTYLGLVYSDIGGPYTPKTLGGNKYYVTFLDSATKWAEIRLIKSKDEVYNCFLEYLALEERESRELLKRLHSDNGLEYKNKEFQALFAKKGIKATFSAPYAHEQNGAAEILNRTLITKVRSLLINAKLPKYLWGEALNAAVYLYNRTPHTAIDYKTPYEAKYGKKPDLSHIKIWGSIA